jgi:hypothetical protein
LPAGCDHAWCDAGKAEYPIDPVLIDTKSAGDLDTGNAARSRCPAQNLNDL